MRRYRPALSVALFVLAALTLSVGALALWANRTVYDSATFGTRSVELLDAPKARAELADRITEELAGAGYRPAVVFRPALQFAVEVAVGTEAFRSIFRGSVQRFHAALLADRGGGGGLDLSDTLSVITATVQLPGDARESGGNEALGSTLESVTRRAADLRVWDWDGLSAVVGVGAVGLAVAFGGAGIAVAVDRRRALSRLGLAVMSAGVIVLAVRALTVLAVRRLIDDPALSDALGDGVGRVTEDVQVIGLWLLGYGAVVVAAVSHRRLTPAAVSHQVAGWIERRRAERRGSLVIGLGLIVAGLAVTLSSPIALLRAAVYVGGLWLVYLGVHELVIHITAGQTQAERVAEVHGERRRLLLAGGAVGVVLAILTAGFVTATRRADARAEVAGKRRCNGDAELCSARLDQVTFPGTHNSMSASLYPGWLFGEQIPTIKAQLDAGVRAFLFDTHYGVATNVGVPGTNAPLVVTDRAAELSAPPGSEVDIDPTTEQRAAALRQRAPRRADAQRQIFLCHNYCELGAVRLSSVLADVSAFLDSHADDVVLLIIQDATTVADTVAALEQAGLGAQAATLTRGQPLPTLGELIDSDKRLLVFAEQGGDQAPPWYMKAYDWFQETGFTFASVDAFNCQPNRGSPDNPLFLLNHWVGRSPPDPGVATRANERAVLQQRVQTCEEERNLLPNVVAVDFASRGDVLAVARALGDQMRDRGPQGGTGPPGGGPSSSAAPSTTGPPSPPGPATPPEAGPDLPDVPSPTPVTSLTGGDPAAFCAAYPDVVAVLEAFALVALSESTSDQGLADLAFGPLLARTLQRSVAAAPAELAGPARALLARAQAAVAALSALGVPPATVDALADAAAAGVQDVAADPLGLQQQLVGRLQAAVGQAPLADAGRAFIAAQGDVAADLDLGDVSAEVARDAGYDCLAAPEPL